jgi:hypothetical protein
MKQFFYFVLILGLIYFCYWYITRSPELVSVYGSLRIFEDKNPDVNEEETIYNASVHGTAKNTGDIPAKNIWITYKIENQLVNAYINELLPNQSHNFRTGVCKVKIKNPEVKLDKVTYN